MCLSEAKGSSPKSLKCCAQQELRMLGGGRTGNRVNINHTGRKSVCGGCILEQQSSRHTQDRYLCFVQQEAHPEVQLECNKDTGSRLDRVMGKPSGA